MGPVCVVEDLVPYLPGHATAGVASNGVGAVSAAPLGNAAVLPISWMYCRMMGAKGLQAATETAILSANYISARLKDHYPTLYASPNGHVAHECILDLRPLKDSSGVTAEDVAKRLIDYGFHAPTLSFPVPGTLMVEPTESEPLAELDRFIDAMIAIRGEIRRVEEGVWPKDDNPLKHAPHTAASLLGTEWPHPICANSARFRWRNSSRPSTGRRSAASTTCMATATCSAAACRWATTRKPKRPEKAAQASRRYIAHFTVRMSAAIFAALTPA